MDQNSPRLALGKKSLLAESVEPNWITFVVAVDDCSGVVMRSVEERAYVDALAVYREVLAVLDGQLRAGKARREDILSELNANVRLDTARRAYLDTLEPS